MPVHLEGEHNVVIDPNDPPAALLQTDTELTAYFRLNAEDEDAQEYFYKEIPAHYTYTKRRGWQPRLRRHDRTISRMYTVNCKNLELYALRLLLLSVRGATSYENLRTGWCDLRYTSYGCCCIRFNAR